MASALVLSLVGCTQITVNSDYDPTADFKSLRTYTWRKTPPTIPDDPRLAGPFFENRVRHAIEEELAAKGFKKQLTGDTDFLVGYHAVLKQELDVTTMNESYGYRRGWGWGGMSETHVSSFEQGTLILDVLEPGTKRLLWRGAAEAIVNFGDSQEKRERRLKRAVKKLLKPFPPK